MRPDHLLRFDYWLDLSVSAQPAGPAMWLAVAAGALGSGLAGIALARGWLGRDIAIPWLVAAGLVGLVGLGRLIAHPLLGLRLGWLAAALIAALPLARRAVSALRADGALADGLRALTFARAGMQGRWRAGTLGAWLGLHLLGLSATLANLGLPILLGPALALGVIGLPALAGRRAAPAALTPLAFAYAATLLHGLGVRLPGIWNGVLSPLLALIIATAYGLVIAGWLAVGGDAAPRARWRFVTWSAALLVAAALGWSAWAGATLRAHGVTGSDPYAYAQMGVDLVTRGTVLHPFPLAGIAYGLGIPVAPTVHVGYRIPDAATGQAATVWPPGYAAFTGLAYLVAGEDGIFLVTPLLNLLALLSAGWFALVAAGRRTPQALAVAGLTIALTATAYQQVEWQMVPMADVAAQLFTLLAVGLALGAHGRSAGLRAALSGLCLGIAFDIRYTQVLLAPALALALAWDRRGVALDAGRLGRIAICAGTALIAAAPVLGYHWAVFGSPFVTGSDELAHFSLARLPETAGRTLAALDHYREFGLLWLPIGIGLLAAARYQRRALAVVLLACAVLFGFHALYTYLRPRDLLFLFPFLAWLAALGSVAAARATYWAAHRSGRPRLWAALRVGLLGALSVCLVLRAMETLAMPANRGFAAFGHLVRAQRDAFARLGQVTPADAVIGTSLNGGAIELHAGRLAFRPAGWTADELMRFVEAAGRPVFVLDDGEELEAALRALRARYGLVEVARLDVPYYDAVGGGSRNRRAPLYRVGTLQ